MVKPLLRIVFNKTIDVILCPIKSGELLHVATILSESKANVIKLDHNQSKVMDRFKQA